MAKIIPLRLEEEIAESIDMLVELGIYKSRNEALRDLIKTGLEEFKWIPQLIKAANKLLEIEEEEGEIPIRIERALRQLLEERSRF